MESNKSQQILKYFEMGYLLFTGGFHILGPFLTTISGVLPFRLEVLWLIVPMSMFLGVLCIVYSMAYKVSKQNIREILKWICVIMFGGGAMTHLLYAFGVIPSLFVTMTFLSAIFGGIMDILLVIIVFDYGRRLKSW